MLMQHGIKFFLTPKDMENFKERGTLSYKTFVHSIAGGLGAVFAITVFYPFEIARTRLQVDGNINAHYSPFVIADIFKQEGCTGLYRGWRSLVVAYFLTQCVYFYIFHGFRSYFSIQQVAWQGVCDLFWGIIAGTLAVLVSNPFWVVNTRLKLQGAKLSTNHYKHQQHPNYTGILDCLLKIAKYDGFKALWGGLVPSLILVSNPSIQFMVYELLKSLTVSFLASQVLDAYLYFALGAVAKAVATVVTYPLQLHQTCSRAGVEVNTGIEKPEVCSWTFLRSQFRGLESKLTQTVLTAALMFVSYEKIAQWATYLLGTTE